MGSTKEQKRARGVYYGKVCKHHPELDGLRVNYGCPGCQEQYYLKRIDLLSAARDERLREIEKHRLRKLAKGWQPPVPDWAE